MTISPNIRDDNDVVSDISRYGKFMHCSYLHLIRTRSDARSDNLHIPGKSERATLQSRITAETAEYPNVQCRRLGYSVILRAPMCIMQLHFRGPIIRDDVGVVSDFWTISMNGTGYVVQSCSPHRRCHCCPSQGFGCRRSHICGTLLSRMLTPTDSGHNLAVYISKII